jgi:hypothetical protein
LLLAFGLGILSTQLGTILTDRFHAVALLGAGSPDVIGNPSPAVAAVASAVRSVFGRAAMLAALALLVRRIPKRWMLAPLGLLAAAAMVADEVRTPGEFALEYVLALLAAGCAVAFCVWFARNNYLAYALVLGGMALRPAIVELMGSGNAGLQMQAWAVVAVAVAGVGWAVGPALARRA